MAKNAVFIGSRLQNLGFINPLWISQKGRSEPFSWVPLGSALDICKTPAKPYLTEK
jgi:hypothetical protein